MHLMRGKAHFSTNTLSRQAGIKHLKSSSKDRVCFVLEAEDLYMAHAGRIYPIDEDAVEQRAR